MRRVAITGLGVVSAAGQTREGFWDAVSNGRSGIGPLAASGGFRGEPRMACAAQASAFDPLAHLDPKQADYLDRFAQFGVVAGRDAVRDAGLVFSAELAANTAIATGTSLGGKYIEDDGYFQMYGEGAQRFHPLSIPKAMHNALTSQLCLEFGVTGPAWTVSTACASAAHAIGQAFWLVRNGSVDCALAGGSEAPFTMGVIRAWEAMRVLATDTCRPFSRNRTGLVLGEGAAMLVLEPLDAALARGARIYAELCGFGMSSDAHHITMPSANGAAKAMRAALADARIDREQVGYVNAHGTGTKANDVTETAAIHSVFGSQARDRGRLAVSSTKAVHGHTLGAAGAVEAVATILAVHHGVLPPTANYQEADPDCDLDYVIEGPRETRVEAAMSNSFAFGGLNAVLVFRRV